MVDNQEKIVHFDDYENVHKHIPIDEIARGNHQRVLLFVGNQQTIPNDWLIVDYNITVIRVGKTSKDNVDFHISAYLGMVHVGRENYVRFIVWSKVIQYSKDVDNSSVSFEIFMFDRLNGELTTEFASTDKPMNEMLGETLFYSCRKDEKVLTSLATFSVSCLPAHLST